MKNMLKEDGDKLGKIVKNVNRMIILFELIGLGILIWIFSVHFLPHCGV